MDQNSHESEEDSTEEYEEKSFLERVADLINALMSIEEYEEDTGLKNFQKVIQTIEKKKGDTKDRLENEISSLFEQLYEDHKEDILEEDFDFLTKKDVIIVFGKSGKTNIKLSEIYSKTCNDFPESITTIEACLYFIFQHTCPDEDIDDVIEICKQFELDDEGTGGDFINFIGNIIGRVSEKMENNNSINIETSDGKMDTSAIGSVVQELFGDEVIQDSMQNMMRSVNDEHFDPNAVLGNLMNLGKKK